MLAYIWFEPVLVSTLTPLEAWTEQTQVKRKSEANVSRSQPGSDREEDSSTESNPSPLSPPRHGRSFFLTDRQLSRSMDFGDSDFTDFETLNPGQ